MPKPMTAYHPDRQQGAALFMALIFLLVMTILGVFGMNISRMENLMAGNNQFQTTALNNAELTVAVVEDMVSSWTLATLPNPEFCDAGDEFYDHTGVCPPYLEPHDLNWSFVFADHGDNPDIPENSRYVVEYYGKTVRSGGNLEWQAGTSCSSSDCAWVFAITAQADASRGAKRTVQSVYITESSPFE